MQLIISVLAVLSIVIGLLIAFPPESEMDRSIKDAMRYPANKDAMARAIRGDSK